MTKKYVEGNQYNPDIYRSDLDHWQDGEYTVYRTTQWTAPGCHDGCGILCYVNKEGKLEKVEGDPANGYSRGALCMRCLDLVEAMYAEDRLKYPMKRAFEDRGKDAWERITLGRGVRPHRREGALLPADLRRRLHRGAAGHRPQHHVLPFHGLVLHRVQQPVGHRRVSVRQLVLWAARLGHGAHGRLLFDLRHVPGAARTLRLPRLRAARVHPRVGKRRHRVEPGRLLGTLDRWRP